MYIHFSIKCPFCSYLPVISDLINLIDFNLIGNNYYRKKSWTMTFIKQQIIILITEDLYLFNLWWVSETIVNQKLYYLFDYYCSSCCVDSVCKGYFCNIFLQYYVVFDQKTDSDPASQYSQTQHSKRLPLILSQSIGQPILLV